MGRVKVKQKFVISVKHSLELIEVFRKASKDEFGVTELSTALGLHKNKVFRLLATLSSCGYIEQNPENENYRLGIGIFDLGQKFINKLGILSVAQPFMKKITQTVGESSYIGIRRSSSAIYLGISETCHPVRVASRVGKEVPVHATAIGKVQLAFAKEEEINALYPEGALTRFTANTIVNFQEFKRHLKEVALKEYAIDNEEFETGVSCVAVPIRDSLGHPIAALSVSGPSSRMGGSHIKDEILPVIQKFSKDIAKRLGGEK